jgi:hypothetical protein
MLRLSVMLRFIGAWAVLACAPFEVQAFGEKGHRLVGAIADKLLESKPEGVKVTALLEGISLSEASIIADDIKRWDLTVTTSYPWTSNPALYRAMKAFVKETPDHSVFHLHEHFGDRRSYLRGHQARREA